ANDQVIQRLPPPGSSLAQASALLYESRAPRRGGLFFFQAEDGIRDLIVTGVQTCALPISPISMRWPTTSRSSSMSDRSTSSRARSEERRVGKECRYRWLPEHLKKNGNFTHAGAELLVDRAGAVRQQEVERASRALHG